MNKIKNINDLKDNHKDGIFYILANGPSVGDIDLSFLKNELVIGMNASTILDKKWGFQSQYYVVSDKRFLTNPEKRHYGTSALSQNVTRVFRKEVRSIDDPKYNDQTYYIPAIARDGFSDDLSRGYYFGCTTTLLAIQLANYLGAKKIYLLGCDLTYPEGQPRFYTEQSNEIEDSFTSIQIYNIVTAFNSLKEKGVELINCSENSLLSNYLGYSPAIPSKPSQEKINAYS